MKVGINRNFGHDNDIGEKYKNMEIYLKNCRIFK